MAERRVIDIEDLLVWAVRDQCADRVADQGAAFVAERYLSYGPVSGDGAAGVMRGVELGVRVDECAVALRHCNDDAEAVWAAVQRLDGFTASVVGYHARTGTRPDWGEGLQTRFPRVQVNGWRGRWTWVTKYPRPKGMRVEEARTVRAPDSVRRGKWFGLMCAVDWIDDLDEPGSPVAGMRGRWTRWHDALCDLAGTDLALEAFEVAPPGAPAKPWENNENSA